MVGSAFSLGEDMVNRHVAERKVIVAAGAFSLRLRVGIGGSESTVTSVKGLNKPASSSTISCSLILVITSADGDMSMPIHFRTMIR